MVTIPITNLTTKLAKFSKTNITTDTGTNINNKDPDLGTTEATIGIITTKGTITKIGITMDGNTTTRNMKRTNQLIKLNPCLSNFSKINNFKKIEMR